ncbi:MAG: hypothetical protein RLZZ45_1948, partial [Bacteroidota bacterium]
MKLIILSTALLCSVAVLAQDSLTKQDIKASAKLIDAKYSEKEIDMMMPDLLDNIIDYRRMHLLGLDNSIPMSLAQRMQPDAAVQQKIKWKYNKKIQLPANKNEWAFLNIKALGSLLRNGSISSTELTAFFIERIKKYGDTLQCVV